MKGMILATVVILVGLTLLMSGTQTMTGYYAEPSGYGFYHIWTANLYIAVSLTLMGLVSMFFVVKKLDRFFF